MEHKQPSKAEYLFLAVHPLLLNFTPISFFFLPFIDSKALFYRAVFSPLYSSVSLKRVGDAEIPRDIYILRGGARTSDSRCTWILYSLGSLWGAFSSHLEHSRWCPGLEKCQRETVTVSRLTPWLNLQRCHSHCLTLRTVKTPSAQGPCIKHVGFYMLK